MTASDHVTGLAARADLQHAIEAACRSVSAEPAAAVICDVIGLKAINAERGFTAGDDVLRAAAERLRAEAGGATILGRLGGDEFVALFTGPESAAAARQVARRLAAADFPALRSAAVTFSAAEPPRAVIDRLYAAMRAS